MNKPKSESPQTHDLYAVRLGKLNALRESGFDPFRANWEQEHTSAQARSIYTEEKEKSPTVKVAGRIVVFRLMGKAAFGRKYQCAESPDGLIVQGMIGGGRVGGCYPPRKARPPHFPVDLRRRRDFQQQGLFCFEIGVEKGG